MAYIIQTGGTYAHAAEDCPLYTMYPHTTPCWPYSGTHAALPQTSHDVAWPTYLSPAAARAAKRRNTS